MLLCENGELKLASGSVGEELSLLPEERTGEGGQRLGVQKSRRCWDIGPTGDNRCWGLGRWNRGKTLLQSFFSHPVPQPRLLLSASIWTQTSQQSSLWTVLDLDTAWSSMAIPGKDGVVTCLWFLPAPLHA